MTLHNNSFQGTTKKLRFFSGGRNAAEPGR